MFAAGAEATSPTASTSAKVAPIATSVNGNGSLGEDSFAGAVIVQTLEQTRPAANSSDFPSICKWFSRHPALRQRSCWSCE